ncbi:MAG: YfhO family protein [Pseudomonadota bacterium]
MNAAADDVLRVNFANDLNNHIWPYMAYASDVVRSGDLPLWNPFNTLGTSMLGQLGIGLLHPTIWVIFLLEDTPSALLVNQLLTVLIVMAGMYFYGRHLRLAPFALFLAVGLIGFTGFTESFSHTEGASFCWLPFILYFAHRCFEQPSIRLASGLSVSLALCFLGGFPNFFFYTCLVVAVYLGVLSLFAWRLSGFAGISVRALVMVLAVVFTLGLVAVQLLPAYELSTLSVRNVHSTSIYNPDSAWEQFSVWLALGNFMFPDRAYIYGNPLLEVESGIYYLGATLLLSPFAFLHRELLATSVALSAGFLIVFLFVMSYQIPALAFLLEIPLAGSLRVNGRAVAYLAFFLIVLAAIGLSYLAQASADRLVDRLSDRWVRPVAIGCTVAGAIALAMAGWKGATDFPAFAGLMVGAGLVCCLLFFRGMAKSGVLFGWLLALAIVADAAIQRQNRFLVPAFNNHHDIAVENVIDDYRLRGEGYRLLVVPSSPDETYVLANLGMKRGVPNISAYDSFTHLRWLNYLSHRVGDDEFDATVRRSPLQRFYGDLSPELAELVLRDETILGMASVKYLYSDKGVATNPTALPRAYAVTEYVSTESERETLAALAANAQALADIAVIEGEQPTFPSRTHQLEVDVQPPEVSIVRYTANEVELSVSVGGDSLVVLTDAYFPGWEAHVDGEVVEILRANSLFRAVEVPPGEHSVVFRYRPVSVLMGVSISLLTGSLMLVLIICEHYHRKRGGERSRST